MRVLTAVLALLLTAVPDAGAQTPPAPRDVTVAAPDGTPLRATYYAAPGPGPGVILLHQCNATRDSWTPVAGALAAAGIHALTLDYRGYGDSGGPRFRELPDAEAGKTQRERWPGDVDAAYGFLRAQPGVDGSRIGAGGGSCGVVQAVALATRHPEIRSLVLLAGPLDAAGMTTILDQPWRPIFSASAETDPFDDSRPDTMRWILAMSGNPRNLFSEFKDGGHGTELFAPHPELPRDIVDWYRDTLVDHPADPSSAPVPAASPARAFWTLASAPDGVDAAVALADTTRERDPAAHLFAENPLNQLGYAHLQAGRTEEAIKLFTLNTVAYPHSANTFDSLGDAYAAAGQRDRAIQAARKALELLADDPASAARKDAIRRSAEQKLADLPAKP